MGVILSAGSSIKLVVKILPNKTIDQIIKIAKRADKQKTVIFLPYLSGERTPHQIQTQEEYFESMQVLQALN